LFGYTREQLARVQSEIALPIVAHNHAIGALVVQSEQADAFDLEDERLLKIVTDQISVALDNARHHAEVQAQARLDSLTQVLNHGAFVATLHTLVKHCREEETSLSLIMLDVDLFKEYNDRFGHVAGDAALKTTVQAIRAHVKSRDAVGRWGGEEFGIALIGADKEQAYGVAQRIRETLASLVPVDRLGREMPPPSVSQGIATLDVDAKDADNLVDVADQALYQAKGAGRDQVRLAGQD
jgi:diguanylate cyclase (GGDEF)-like protein